MLLYEFMFYFLGRKKNRNSKVKWRFGFQTVYFISSAAMFLWLLTRKEERTNLQVRDRCLGRRFVYQRRVFQQSPRRCASFRKGNGAATHPSAASLRGWNLNCILLSRRRASFRRDPSSSVFCHGDSRCWLRPRSH